MELKGLVKTILRRTVTVTFLIHVNHQCPYASCLSWLIKGISKQGYYQAGKVILGPHNGQSHCGGQPRSPSHNTCSFPLVRCPLWHSQTIWEGECSSNCFVFWFPAIHWKLTPWPPSTTKVFCEPGTPLPAVGKSQVCEVWPPACRWQLGDLELHTAGTTGWWFPPGSEPTGVNCAVISASLLTKHTSEDFLKKQTNPIKTSTCIIHVSDRFLKGPKHWNKLSFPLCTSSSHLTGYQSSCSNLAVAPSFSHSTRGGPPHCQPTRTDTLHNRMQDF